MRALVALVALAACGDPPPLALEFRITHGMTEPCTLPGTTMTQTTSCADVTMLCAATLSVRVFPPSDPTAPYISMCKLMIGAMDACAIAGVDLSQPVTPIPEQRLEVEMAVYPTIKLPIDGNGNAICPPAPQFAANGYPVDAVAPCDSTITDPTDAAFCWPPPAIGGSTIYNPGDTATIIDLGCPDLAEMRSCTGGGTAVTATVIDFDTQVAVSDTADLEVSVGEPMPNGSDYVLSPMDTHALTLAQSQPPGWSGDVPETFQKAACLDVLEDVAQSTSSLHCVSVTTGTKMIDLVGYRLAKATLGDILNALGLAEFPDQGLVVGIVLDELGNPLPNMTVQTTTGTVQYLSADRMHVSGAVTSMSGVFVSTDATFNTTFTVRNVQPPLNALGGVVEGKVTIVVLQASQPTT